MSIIYSKQAVKALNRMDVSAKQRIRTAVERLPQGDVKKLQGRSISTYRLRVGGWRVFFSYNGETIEIEKIAPRGGAYKGE